MRHRLVLTVIPALLMVSGAAYAQAPSAGPAATPGSAGVVAPQPGSTGAPGTVSATPTGRPGDTITNNSAAGGNADQPSRAVPQGGGGGGSK